MTRTVVSFEAPEGAFPRSRGSDDRAPGYGIAALVSDALRRAGIDHLPPEEREGWAWDVRATTGQAAIESTIGLVDDDPIQWLIVTTVRLPRRLFTRSRAEAATAAASALEAWVRSLADVVTGPHGMTNVRWYDQESFDRDHGVTWAAGPFE